MDKSDSLEGRLDYLEARIEIGDLVAAYGRVVDDRDWQSLGALYCKDATFDAVEGPSTGRDRIIEYYEQRTSMFGVTYHYPHSVEVTEVDGDLGSGVVCAHAELAIGGRAFWIALRYFDSYRREDGQWRFAERRVEQLYAMELSELPDGMDSLLRKRWPGTEPAPADWGPGSG
ncbi:MAG: hypothetical protein CL741_06355 [Chloroflexi bacterium]|nr:hypothetical protein [Chloroflexota bacterium]|tara:strand:- start:863 stop:1381 length:519 start_codon:yes stop_codon:yes gene_type:complete